MIINWKPDDLQRIVDGTRFLMPGWRIWLGDDNETGEAPTLHIASYTINSYHPEEMIGVNHSFLVPLATYNDRTWKAWIRECYEKVWRHEIGEMLLFDGVREFAPHHGNGEDPYMVWHNGDTVDTQVRAGEDKPEIDYNTVVMQAFDGAFYHTYSPECPPDCRGQMEGCAHRDTERASTND